MEPFCSARGDCATPVGAMLGVPVVAQRKLTYDEPEIRLRRRYGIDAQRIVWNFGDANRLISKAISPPPREKKGLYKAFGSSCAALCRGRAVLALRLVGATSTIPLRRRTHCASAARFSGM